MNIVELSSSKSYVLAIDDELINRLVLEDLLEDTYELALLDNSESCFASIAERRPELILLDVNMPGLNGFDLCRQLKSNPSTANIPIIFLTAKIATNDERLGLDLGAVDYITKPFSESILLARMKTHLSLSQTQRLLEKSHAKLKRERDYIEYIILSMRDDCRYKADNLSTLVAPVEKSSGDLVLSACAQNGHRHILLGDFTGHGLSAAVAGPLVSSLFYSRAEQGFSLGETAAMINHELSQKLPSEIFMAALLIDWNVVSNQLTVWNCGMPPLLHYRNGAYLQDFKSDGLALGIVDCFYGGGEPKVIELCSGDLFYGYSDGVQDVVTQNNERFGDVRVRELLQTIVEKKLSLQHVLPPLEIYAGTLDFADDVTLMELQIP
jgi:CheY-like chemotaxis protein